MDSALTTTRSAGLIQAIGAPERRTLAPPADSLTSTTPPVPVDIATRAAECAVLQRRQGAREPVKVLYLRSHSLLRELRRHLAFLDARPHAA